MGSIALNKPAGGQTIIAPEDGTSTETVTIPSVGVGKVLQTKSVSPSQITFSNSLSPNVSIITSLTITPKSENSKMIVFAGHEDERGTGTGGGSLSAAYYFYTDVFANGVRQSSAIGSVGNAHGHYAPQQSRQSGSLIFEYDVQNTSPITFDIRPTGGSNIDGVTWHFYYPYITVMEIAQ